MKSIAKIYRHTRVARTARSGALLLLLCLACPTLYSQEAMKQKSGPKMRLAVMDMGGSGLQSQSGYGAPGGYGGGSSFGMPGQMSQGMMPPPSNFARGMTEMITTELVKTNRFIVLERAAVDKVVNEQNLGAGGRVNPETAPQLARLIGAQAIITGDVTDFNYSQSSVAGALPSIPFGGKLTRVSANVAVDLRIIDANTGQVLMAQRAKGSASNAGVALQYNLQDFSSAASANTPLGKAAREAVQGVVTAIVAGMAKTRWSARVIDVRGPAVYINAGVDVGIAPGVEFDVYRQDAALIDPESGVSLGAPESKIGSLSVDSPQDKFSIAKLTDGTGVKRGDVVRMKGEASGH
ncbi:MAG TPA: CsgG/HfaB family protein [Steroidobacteraceae bacterium]